METRWPNVFIVYTFFDVQPTAAWKRKVYIGEENFSFAFCRPGTPPSRYNCFRRSALSKIVYRGLVPSQSVRFSCPICRHENVTFDGFSIRAYIPVRYNRTLSFNISYKINAKRDNNNRYRRAKRVHGMISYRANSRRSGWPLEISFFFIRYLISRRLNRAYRNSTKNTTFAAITNNVNARL